MDTILVVNASTRSDALRHKLAGIKRYARERGWNVQPLYSSAGRRAIAKYRRNISPVGVIVESCAPGAVEWREAEGKAGRVPVVHLDCEASGLAKGEFAVIHDQAATARMAFAQFMKAGFKSVAYAGWFSRRFWSVARGVAFRAEAAANAIVCVSFEPDLSEARLVEYDAKLVEWVFSLPPDTGIFAANDKIASLVLAACRRLELSVPRQVAVLGVDNEELRCETETPTLSSIQVDFDAAGYAAARLLDAAISGADTPAIVEFGPMCVVHRESTRTCRRSSPKISDAMELIRSAACDGLTAEAVVKMLGGSRRSAEMRFREATGRSILEEIQRVRFDKIRFLLAHTNKEIGAIANFCGYKSPESLRRLFQKREGMSMSEYRKRHSVRQNSQKGEI